MIQDKQIALIFFSRSASAEAQAKKWLPEGDRQQNSKLAAFLINKSKNLLHDSELPVFHFHEHNQAGKSFGERIANAFETVFNTGYEAAICIGNDTPGIQQIDWSLIKRKLNENKNIIGPNKRQGAYLIALCKSRFNKNVFQNLKWQTNSLLDQLVELGPTEFLQPESDLNDGEDIRLLIKIISSFKRFILSLWPTHSKTYAISFFNTQAIFGYGLRGPPAYL